MSRTSMDRRRFLAQGAHVAGSALLGGSLVSCLSDPIVAPQSAPKSAKGMLPNTDVGQSDESVTVFPTGIYPDDVVNVQSAVDSIAPNGTVILKSTNQLSEPQFFNFGDDVTGRGGVNVANDVVICGEATPPCAFVFPNGQTPQVGWTPNRTVIYGGLRPIHCYLANSTATTLKVRRLYFAYPALNAVFVNKSAGLEVAGCVIYDIKAAAVPELGLVPAIGIEATGLAQTNPELQLYGEFHVFDNAVKRLQGLDYASVDLGIVLQLTAMTGHIHHNKVTGFGYYGIGVANNRADCVIEDNQVMSCGYGTSAQSGGICARRIVPNPGGEVVKVSIRRNEIIGGDYSRNGVGLLGASNVTVTENVIHGVVRSDGIRVTPFVPAGQPSQPSRNNVIERNDLRSLVAGHAQALFDTTCDENQSRANDFGEVDLSGSGVAGILVRSNGNTFTDETFWGNYPGTSGSPAVPCMWLSAGTIDNHVTALRFGYGGGAFDLCTQIRNDDPANSIPGYAACAHVNS